MKWKSITSITLGAALLGGSALAQTTTPPSTGAASAPAQTTNSTKAPTTAQPGTTMPGGDAAKAPAATQPGGTMSGTDTAKTPAMSQGTAGKSKAMSSDMSKAMKGERVRSVQEALKAKGYDPGPIDGVFGPKTQTALKEFQKAESLPESGHQDAQTLAKLGVQ
jgi:hypothetical protein